MNVELAAELEKGNVGTGALLRNDTSQLASGSHHPLR